MITYIGIFDSSRPLIQHHQTRHLPLLTRSSAKSLSTFAAKEVASRLSPSQHLHLTDQPFALFAHKWHSITVACIASKSYPARIAFQLIHQVYEQFRCHYPQEDFSEISDLSLPEIKLLAEKYSKPEEIDVCAGVAGRVQETREVVSRTVEEMLRAGETLEELVAQSRELSGRTREVFKRARRVRGRCCMLM